ncbi:MAG TPA: tRNA lysidine(34) synthetase TilS [Thermoanaerobaculia bacterium]|jgi:tRNA(Ile)-lysidine synthase|nr:tRNA lysidine(34) synthetase TilS [Thermoanaerobaculia bacterium]
MDLLQSLETFFRPPLPLAAGDGVVAAFSGGADSTALLWGLAQLAARRGSRLLAAHLDHGLDPGSAGRAGAAAVTAARLGVPFVLARREVPVLRRPGESVESAARRVRYGFLEEVRAGAGARYIATGHHRDDQAETVLLRLLFGSGIEGLAGARSVCMIHRGAVVRPLLGMPRAALRDAVAAAGLTAVEDPTNADLDTPRNRIRHTVLPALTGEDPDIAPRLARLAIRARGAGAVLDRRVAAAIRLRDLPDGDVAVDRHALTSLPRPLLPIALAALHRRAGAPYPAGEAAREELTRQLAGAASGSFGVRVDCGDGWCWTVEGDLLTLRRAVDRERTADFTYTLEIPGEIEIPELSVRVGLHHRPVEPWMFTGAPHRAGLALPLVAGDRVTVRNRRPGDRLHPLGAGGSRRLKEVLVDRRVPQAGRARIPLLCVGERIAWVPGVTIDHRFRIRTEATAWVATLSSTSSTTSMT